MRSGEEIQAALRRFVSDWESYDGSERGEAQTFLNELFACYGTNRREVGAVFEDAHGSAGIMDLHWLGMAIIEMKAPSQADRLPEHREQALNYWRNSANVAMLREAPPYVVLCAFGSFEVWEPGRFPNAPRVTLPLSELPDRYESLLFLTGGQEPIFDIEHRELTQEAVQTMADLYHRLLSREAAPRETVQSFILQMIWCLFAEDYGMLGGHASQHLVEEMMRQPYWTSYIMLGGLFDALADPTDHGRHGVLSDTRYVNGELFARPAKVHLTTEELELLLEAGRYDWRNVEPTIFGSLMEKCLGVEARWELGAHYTHEADIMKIVRPTVVQPWRERIDAVSTPDEARRLLDELCDFRVLDPACGCGNFLYVAYRELRALEYELKQRIATLAKRTGLPEPAGELPSYPLRNLQGIDIESISLHIAQVTLWMGQRQMMDRYGPAEAPLPLTDLSTLRSGDALQMPWPETDCIVGNPPYHGSQHLRRARGDDYLDWLKEAFRVGVKDYCVYWFRKAHDHLRPGQRAGLVGTNSVAQNRARSASLQYVVDGGGVITDAVSTQKWPGEAKVHVSLVNWIKQPTQSPSRFGLDGEEVSGITAELRHAAWARSRSSTLKADLNYTPTTAFETFPWPYPVADEQRESIAEASRSVIARRQQICAREQIGLTRLYNLVDEGAYADLKKLHRELDEAVAAAYGWPRSVAQDGDEIVRRLLALNRESAAGERPYDPFGAQATQPASEPLDIG